MTALRTLFLAISLVVIGFLVGYGFQSRSAQQQRQQPVATAVATPQAPQIKGLHSSPDGKFLAFTGVYARSEQAGLWVLNPQTGTAKDSPSPAGWQDFVTQWRDDGSLLVEREKIPRPVAEATGGLYTVPVDRSKTSSGELEPVRQGDLPDGEKIITGLIAPGGELIIKTRREPKALFKMNGSAQLIDRAEYTYGQNRPVVENGKLVFYVVRNIPGQTRSSALYRVIEQKAQQLSPVWQDVSWSYVAPSGKQIIVARRDENGIDWNWTLYRIGVAKIETVTSATIPADVISVYWSPDEKRVLGAAGEKLWIIDVPSLKTTQLGNKADWNADDASWMGSQTVAIGESGEIWRVDVPSGKAAKVWRFPKEFWD
ncbi:hypothetical protein EON80_18300 [bacterium]|nr:MAG: hypothetical protein EON80_18300 [bacterium]